MKWLKKLSFNTKREKESNQYIVLYHFSPEKITALRPFSRLGSKYIPTEKGLYFSESFRSMFIDWAPYIRGKKQNLHRIYTDWNNLNTKRNDLEKILKKPNLTEIEKKNIQNELNSIETKKNKLMETIKRDEFDKNNKPYNGLYLTKVSCPKFVLDKSYDFMNKVFEDQNSRGVASFGFWNWGSQVFIPSKFFNYLKIISSKKYSEKELLSNYDRLLKRKPRGWTEFKET